MEMSENHSNNYNIPAELHVAQQRRRDKLRVQQFDDLQDHNNNNFQPHGSPMNMILPSEMLDFTSSSHTLLHVHGGPFPNIHPTRFVAPSSSDSFQSWVPANNDHYGRPSQFSAFPSQFIPQHHNNNQPYPVDNNYNGWGNNNNNDDDELPLNPHGLSLSLSSNQICEYQHHLGGGDPRELKPFESASISSIVEHGNNNNSNSYSSSNNQVSDMGGSTIQIHRNMGPLGPFTGYAAILKSSKFLKPAQSLLDEFFGVAGILRADDESESIPSSMAMVPKVHGSKDDVSCMRLSCESSYTPDCHETKAKLLHLQQEVCKRHKQYHQQMEMVITAFDSVPGLGGATPYISRSIKTISRHFRSLKNAISDQLKHIKRALGEDLSSPASFIKSDSNTSLKYDQNYVKARSSFGGPAHLGQQSHVWRPQRGLPERAVSVLRAWLFDHFLHPYPTDNDKQMLATQTGLSRNQVSNWFINARVRLWKPMVEEIHMLETETGLRESNSSNDTVMSVIAKNSQATDGNHSGCKPPPVNLRPCDDEQLEHLGPSTSLERTQGETNTEQLFYKCSRIEKHQVPANVDTSFIGFLPYQRRGLEMGGIGAVSLTLGLRHGSETNQQLQHQFLPQGIPFGGHVIHDFSG